MGCLSDSQEGRPRERSLVDGGGRLLCGLPGNRPDRDPARPRLWLLCNPLPLPCGLVRGYRRVLHGRLIGGPKLAPSISPNKTWSGLIGGAAAACCAGSLFALWLGHTRCRCWAALALLLAIISQGGDLGESFIKRVFGVKNSSGLIPGHGGVLDRLDGLVFAAIGAGLIAVAV